MTIVEAWLNRARTIRAMAWLLFAMAVVALVPFAHWRVRLGSPGSAESARLGEAVRLARQVERGANRLRLPVKCLPRAMALSWMLRRRMIAHRLVIAARPQHDRSSKADALHAWVECCDQTILGELDGPWILVFTAG